MNQNNIQITNLKMEHLTKQTFLEKVFDYEKNKDWKFEGDLPCIIDFYADWCQPCKIVAPILEELASEYEGKINIYKVNTESETELAAAFGIRSIPSLLFIPMDGQPQMAMGALPKDSFKQAIADVLMVKEPETA
ncbi:MAG: thioredoxin [bacterium]|jgi:thioredoxin 1